MSGETSSDQCSSVLNATIRTGLLYWPDSRSATMVSTSAFSIWVFPVNRPVGKAVYHKVDGFIRSVGDYAGRPVSL